MKYSEKEIRELSQKGILFTHHAEEQMVLPEYMEGRKMKISKSDNKLTCIYCGHDALPADDLSFVSVKTGIVVKQFCFFLKVNTPLFWS